ncbi:hypothetical protein PtA15_6A700 [Puccinia triticina]|uniref:Secreted protein n=1 Tax=Puccinia triticina TaxID=208348 RepID=A0ABY7CMX6_9BASI|nr:uncharacterized protein PtA15_6A700 [Puccinia triticina]WAQ86070.1 hypothetical protein PtA15_6A700 [Puccinia triticina]WAR55962.1 hypothetical protein PtB15_6B706 [Puccinia triticina]
MKVTAIMHAILIAVLVLSASVASGRPRKSPMITSRRLVETCLSCKNEGRTTWLVEPHNVIPPQPAWIKCPVPDCRSYRAQDYVLCTNCLHVYGKNRTGEGYVPGSTEDACFHETSYQLTRVFSTWLSPYPAVAPPPNHGYPASRSTS